MLTIFQPSFVFAENLSATCFAYPSAARVGDEIIWTVIPQGGIGSYGYSWSGDDDLFGNNQSIAKVYDTDGEKEATVVVFSGGEFVTPTCIIEISEVEPVLSASCFPQSSVVNLSQEVEWSAEARGGDGKYEYSWSGDENLGGENRRSGRKQISKTYQTTGIKSATVVISSGEQSLSRTCNVTVEPDPLLTGICYPNNREASIGESVVWTAEARGGSGEYEYSWSGAESERGFRRNKQAASAIYDTFGVKTVSVSISSGNQSITEICSINVGSVLGARNQAIFPSDTSFTRDYSNNGFVAGVYSDNSQFDQSKQINSPNEPVDQQENESLPTTTIFPLGWAVFFALSSILGAILVFIFILLLNKKSRKSGQNKKLAFEENGIEKSISRIIQAEASKKEVIVSFEALKLLIKESEEVPSVALKNLEQIIDEIKTLPIPFIPGEDRWPSISKETIENFFLRKKTGAI